MAPYGRLFETELGHDLPHTRTRKRKAVQAPAGYRLLI